MTMNKITLFQLKSPSINIYIEAYFDDGKLVIEGQDIGKTVKEAWGDSDYEYSVTIPRHEVIKLYSLFQVKEGDKEGLLKAIAEKYNTNTCYSEFRDLLEKNGIESDGFTWA
jgi:hypothetical protein